MKNLLRILILTIVCCGNLLSQEIDTTAAHLFKVLNDDTNAGIFIGCDVFEDGYLAIGSSANEQGEIYLSLKTFGLTGNLLSDIELDTENEGYNQVNYGRCLGKVNDSEWVLAYQVDNGGQQDTRAIKFNLEGELLWQVDLGGDYYDKAIFVLVTDDAKIAVIGDRRINSSATMGFIALLDAFTGEVIWDRIEEDFPTTSFSGHSGGVIHEDVILLSGKKEIDGVFIPYIKQVSLSNGTLIDDFSLSNNVGCVSYLWYIENTSDQFYLLSCNSAEQIWKASIITPDLETLWEHTYTFEEFYGPAPLNPITNHLGGFISVHEDRIDTPLGTRSQLIVFGFDGEGNELFATPIATDSTKEVYVRDFRKTPDGGYLIAAYEHFPVPQRGWLIKTDSLGNTCQLPNCDSISYIIDTVFTSAFELSSERAGIQVYPNPANNGNTLTIELKDLSDQIETIQIVSIDGRKTYRDQEGDLNQITTEGLLPGVYLMKVTTIRGILYSRRLFVE